MRWLLQRSDDTDAPMLLTLDETPPDTESTPARISTLPGGALSITAHTANEARDALAALQHVQQELMIARTRAVGDNVAALGSNVKQRAQRPVRQLRRIGESAGKAVRRGSPDASGPNGSLASNVVIEGLDVALLAAQSAVDIDDALKLVGAAIEAVGDIISAIDLGDLISN